MTLLALAFSASADTGRYTPSGLWFESIGAGSTVVLIHGANLDSRSFASVAGTLAREHRVILVDLRFHGHSGDGTGPFSFEGDLAEVLDAAGVERATLVGHSLGASVAVDFALAHPGRVAGLVLLGPSLSGQAMTRSPAGLEAVAAALKAGDFDRAGVALAQMPVMTLTNRGDLQANVARMVRENTRLFAADRGRVKPLGAPAAGRLGELTMPVLVLMGGQDPSGANEIGHLIATQVHGAREQSFPSCGHLLPIDCGPETASAIERFLRP